MSDTRGYIFQAALEIQRFFEMNGWDFVFIGGLAVIRWGQPRTTVDVDGTVLTLFVDEEKYINAMLDRFASRVSDAKKFAENNRVLLLTASNGIGIDISLGGLPFEQQVVERSSLYEYEKNCVLRTCSAEDLIVLKAFADRDKDWGDVRSILQRQRGKLDINYVLDNLQWLCELKEDPEIVTKLNKMIESTI
ncbi:MAG: nucleotidyltransferase [Planctomycetaceae bacterium]|jgi:hypothetical protein|nr:nucleotidyltransferase [Planctomycetaceae bacterium]